MPLHEDGGISVDVAHSTTKAQSAQPANLDFFVLPESAPSSGVDPSGISTDGRTTFSSSNTSTGIQTAYPWPASQFDGLQPTDEAILEHEANRNLDIEGSTQDLDQIAAFGPVPAPFNPIQVMAQSQGTSRFSQHLHYICDLVQLSQFSSQFNRSAFCRLVSAC